MNIDETLRFLDRVWGSRECWVDLPSKVAGHWVPFNCEWPDDRDLLARRIASCLEDREDVYFSVAQFGGRGRRIQDTLPSSWLWADLDRVDPVFLDEEGLQPTIAWESSGGRWQSLWRLDRSLPPETLARLNRALSYALGADPTGWDLTQVLRPPGTRNFKYDPPADVTLLWDSSKTYRPADIVSSVRKIGLEQGPLGLETLAAPRAGATASSAARRADRERRGGSSATLKLPARARALLRTPPEMVVVGERSARLWEIERLLAEAGLGADEIFDLVWPCAWNKHKEVNSGERRLRQEIDKALAARKTKPRPAPPSGGNGRAGSSSVDLERPRPRAPDRGAPDEEPAQRHRRAASPFVDYATFLGTNIEQPKWLVNELWSAASHGIVGGEPKTGKTTMTLALALSVASGIPFMGLPQFETVSTGPVLVVQEENAPWKVQDTLRKLAWYYKLIPRESAEIAPAPRGSLGSHVVRLDFPKEAELHLLNNYGFNLTEEEDRDMLEDEVRKRGARLVILDPLLMISGGVNLNQAHDVMPLLQWLMALRYNYDVAVIVIHHWHKPSEASSYRRAGQRLMGSAAFHGWIDSALYFERLEDDGNWMNIRMEREYRNVGPRQPLEWGLKLSEPGDLEMDVKMREYNLPGKVLAVVERSPGITITDLVKELGLGAGPGKTGGTHTKEARAKARSLAVGVGCVMEEVKVMGKQGWRVHPPGTELDDA